MTAAGENGSIDDVVERSINPVSVVALIGNGSIDIPTNARYVDFSGNNARFWEQLPKNNHAKNNHVYHIIPENASTVCLLEFDSHGGRWTHYGEPTFKYQI